jgi:hypothetical protein
VVVADLDLGTSLSRSYEYAVDGGRYASYFVQYLLAVAVISLVATPVFTNAGVAGGLAGVVLLAPLGLVFDTATTSFVRDLVDGDGVEESGDTDDREGDDGDGDDGDGDDGDGEDGWGIDGATDDHAGTQSNIPVDM